MSEPTRRTLLWAALFLLIVGGMVGAPEAGVAAAVLGALCALPAVLSGARWTRAAGVLLLLGAVALAASLLPAARRGMARSVEVRR
jgi:hypothetical protein